MLTRDIKLLQRLTGQRYLVFALYSIIAFILYYPTLHADFIYDDLLNIDLNPAIQQLTNIPAIWQNNQTRFLAYWSLSWNYAVGKENPFGYHVFNTLVHVATSVLVYIFGGLILQTPLLRQKYSENQRRVFAFLSGLVFLCHPIQTQAVSYVVQRITSLSAFFYLASLVLFLKFRICRSSPFYWLSLLLAIAGMLTKEVTFTLPFMILVIEFLFFETPAFGYKRRMGYLLPYLLTLPLIPLLLVQGLRSERILASVTAETWTISRWDYFLTQLHVLLTYLRVLFVPLWQNLDYDYPLTTNIFTLSTVSAALVLAGLFLLAFALSKRQKIFSFCVFWFFLTLSVESSFFPINDVIQEHRLYLPMVGFALFVGLLISELIKQKVSYAVVMVLLIFLFCYLTFQRNLLWSSPIKLWQDTASKSPKKPRVITNLAGEYINRKQYDKAIPLLEKAIVIDSTHAKAYFNLASIYGNQGHLQKALNYALKAYHINPYDAVHAQYVGYLFVKMGNFAEGLKYYQNVLRLKPSAKNAQEFVKVLMLYYQNSQDAIQAMQYASVLKDVGLLDIYASLIQLFKKE
jgi:protein O-mannosyl-transferase